MIVSPTSGERTPLRERMAGSAGRSAPARLNNRCLESSRLPQGYVALSAVVGSKIFLISEILFAGKPPCFACSRIKSSFGAM
jgi:hypothetical protein